MILPAGQERFGGRQTKWNLSWVAVTSRHSIQSTYLLTLSLDTETGETRKVTKGWWTLQL